jgi:hypothetical protein
MANTTVLFGEANSDKIYKVGKVGYDSGDPNAVTEDPNATAFTGTIKTERLSPAGEAGLGRFRRVVLRALKLGSWEVTFTIWVDDVQTQRFDNTVLAPDSPTFPLVDQTITVVSDTDDTGEGEAIIEADIDAVGTFIQVQVDIVSTDILGYFLPESIEVHLQPIRQARSQPAGPVTDMTSHTAESQ